MIYPPSVYVSWLSLVIKSTSLSSTAHHINIPVSTLQWSITSSGLQSFIKASADIGSVIGQFSFSEHLPLKLYLSSLIIRILGPCCWWKTVRTSDFVSTIYAWHYTLQTANNWRLSSWSRFYHDDTRWFHLSREIIRLSCSKPPPSPPSPLTVLEWWDVKGLACQVQRWRCRGCRNRWGPEKKSPNFLSRWLCYAKVGAWADDASRSERKSLKCVIWMLRELEQMY